MSRVEPTSSSGILTGARLAVGALEDAGVEIAFGLPGVHNLALWRALGDSPIRLVGVRHEQTAAYAADGYARASGKLGVALTTTGPGAANTLAAVGEAWACRQPILVIATDIPTAARRPGVWRGALHEATDQAAMFAPVTKATFHVRDAAEAGGVVAEAARTAMTAPCRPVYVEIPTDLLAAEVADPRAAAGEPPAPGAAASTRDGAGAGRGAEGETEAEGDGREAETERRAEAQGDGRRADAERGAAAAASAERGGGAEHGAGPRASVAADVAEAARLLAAAERPLIWAGGGCVQADAGGAVAALAEKLAAPVITTYSARGLLPPGHACLVDGPPHVPQVGAVWDEADLVLSLGSDFDGMMTLGWKLPAPATLVAVNVDPGDATKNYAADLVIEADAAATARALLEAVAARPGLDTLADRTAALRAEVRAEIERTDPDAATFLAGLERVLPADATVVCDMCIPGYWIGGFLTVGGPRRLSYPLGWGTLGCGFPQGLGAALAGTGPVVSISGDGGFLYAPGELAAAAQERIPLTAVIVDDGGYGMLRFDQEIHGDPHEGVDLTTPDFVALAGAFGVRAEAVEGLGDDFAAALERQMAVDEPTVLVAKASLRPPPNTSPRWYRR